MIQTIKVTIDENRKIQLPEDVTVSSNSTILVVVINNENQQNELNKVVNDEVLLSEKSLEDWNNKEEDEAWKHLQKAT